MHYIYSNDFYIDAIVITGQNFGKYVRLTVCLCYYVHSGKAYEGTCRIPRQNGDGRGIASARFV